jgi:hypothetical protein
MINNVDLHPIRKEWIAETAAGMNFQQTLLNNCAMEITVRIERN